MTDFATIFTTDLELHGLFWCEGGCLYRNSHDRGFAVKGEVHLKSGFRTRSALLRGLHEIGHCVLWDDDKKLNRRRYEQEAGAERWARARMRSYGIPVPRKASKSGDAYVARMQSWGDAIARSR